MPTENTTEHLQKNILQEITPQELAELLDDHLLDMVRTAAELGETISQEKSNVYYHLRRIRDMLKNLDTSTSSVQRNEA